MGHHLPRILVTALLLVVALTYCTASDTEPRESMLYLCDTHPFLSVSASVPTRNAIPKVQIALKDPRSRQQGFDSKGTRIPQSHYEDIVEVPSSPNRSKAKAIEVCAASEGKYELTIREEGEGRYRVTVGIDNTEFISGNLFAKNGRTRHYTFTFKGKGDDARLTWLDRHGKPQVVIPDSDW